MSLIPVLNALATIAWDTSYSLVVGTLLASQWLAPDRAESGDLDRPGLIHTTRFESRLLLVAIACMLIVHLTHPWFLAASMSGSDRFAEDLALVPTILSSTHQGVLWYINSFAIPALGMAVFLPLTAKTFKNWAALVPLVVMAFTKAAAGHAGADGDFTVAETIQLLHVLATAVWSGAIIVSGLFIVPRMSRANEATPLWSYGNRLSKAVTWALITILVTGVYTSNRELNASLSSLWTSEWGRILLAKVALVLVAILLGSMNRFGCLRLPVTQQRMARMVRLFLLESIVMILVLCLSGLLGGTSPPMAAG